MARTWWHRFALAALGMAALPVANAAPTAPIIVAQAGDCALARDIWADIRDTASPALLQAFVSQSADCPVYVMLAEERLQALGAGKSANAVATPRATIPETECDRLVGLPDLPRLPGLVRQSSQINGEAAVAACTQARAEHPDEKFFALLLALAHLNAEPSNPWQWN